MAGKTLVDADNLLQICSDMLEVKRALMESGIVIPSGTPSSQYGDLIRELAGIAPGDSLNEGAFINPEWVSFSYFSVDNNRNDAVDNLSYDDTANCIDFTAMIKNCTMITNLKLLNMANGLYFTEFAFGCTALKSFNGYDIINGVKLDRAFAFCESLESLHIESFNNVASCSDMLYGCTKLTTFTFNPGMMETSCVIDLSPCINLSIDCFKNIVSSLSTVVPKTGAGIVFPSIMNEKVAELADEEQTVVNQNIEAMVGNGWTVLYN